MVDHLSRRDFLRLTGVALAGAGLVACGGAKDSPPATAESAPTQLPKLTLAECLTDPQKLIMVPEANLADIGVGFIQPDSSVSKTIEVVGKGRHSAVWIRPASQDAVVFRGQNDLAQDGLTVLSNLFSDGKFGPIAELASLNPNNCQANDPVIAGKDNVVGWNLSQIQEKVTGLDKFTTVTRYYDWNSKTNLLIITQSIRSSENPQQSQTSTLATCSCPADSSNWQVSRG